MNSLLSFLFLILLFVTRVSALQSLGGCNNAAKLLQYSYWAHPLARSSKELGGFAYGINAREIQEIADSFAPPNGYIHPILGRRIETTLFNASLRKNFWEKIGVITRDIAGSHLFNDANHRITFEVVRRLMQRNGIITKVSDQALYDIISKVGRNAKGYQTAEDIAAAFRGY